MKLERMGEGKEKSPVIGSQLNYLILLSQSRMKLVMTEEGIEKD